MRESDLEPFAELLDAVCLLLSRGAYVPSAQNLAVWFRALAAYDIATVRAAFDAHVKDPERGRFVPTPADVIAQITGAAAADGRPGSEEAWATAIGSRDEAATVVWTEETAQAWAIARPVMDLGDEVGARMAFRQAYDRMVHAARAHRQPCRWTASLGWDGQRRQLAIEAAVNAGRLPAQEHVALPAPVAQLPLLALSAAAPPPVRQALRELADRLRNRPDPVSVSSVELQRTAQLKALTAERVREHVASGQA